MKELLVPAGNMDCLKAAVLNGADAVYLGGLKFGARAYSKNFNNDELIDAIKYAHLFGVKIYVTVNTMIYSSEIDSVIEYVEFLYKNNVDALIIQDIGLIDIIKNKFPNLEIHSSTQVHTNNNDTLKFLSELGVSRAVLARELSIEEINELDTKLELEVFIHGALCVCYSGECLFSSRIFKRSGNRGECAGVCRLPFKNDDDKQGYYLSCKELNTSHYIEKLFKTKVKSFKIEGRMKSPEYVGCVTRYYRDLLDKFYNKLPVIPNKEIEKDLTILFNREFTKGYLFNETNIINDKTPNHQGLRIGNIIKTDKKYIYIKLSEELNQGDGIRFKDSNEGLIVNYLYDEKFNLINSSNSIVLIKNTFKVKSGDVYKTSGIKLIEKYTKSNNRYINIDMEFNAYYNYMELIINDGINKIIETSNEVYESKTIAITNEDIKNQMKKLGNSIFKLNNFKCNVDDNLFINKKHLNELRNSAIKKLEEKRKSINKKIIINDYKIENKIKNSEFNLSVLVRNESQLEFVLDKCNRVYVDDYNLYKKYQNNNKVYFKTNRVKENRVINNALVTELGSVKYKGIGDYYLNVANEYSLNCLNKYLKLNTLSIELDDNEIKRISKINNNFELVIYTKIDLMITKNKIDSKYLIDRNNNKYNIVTEDNIMHIIDCNLIDKIDNINYYKSLNINNFRIELFDENEKQIKDILDRMI